MYNLKSYREIFEIAKNNKEFTICLKDLSIKESLRVIDFITGLTFINGKLEKISASTFKVEEGNKG